MEKNLDKNSFFHKLKQKFYFPGMKEYSIKYMVIGAMDCILDFIFYFCLTRGFKFWHQHYLLANFLSFMASDAAVFDISRKWIFKLPVLPDDEDEAKGIKLSEEEEKNIHKQYFKYLWVCSIAFIANQSGLFIFVTVIKINDLIIKAAMGIVVGIMRFFTHKLWTFRIKKVESQENNKTKI